MDDLEKKLFVQLDDDMPGQRANALELLREHFKKVGRSFREIVSDIESALPKAKVDELEKKLKDYMNVNAAAAQRDAAQRREIATLKAALWVKLNWRRIAEAGAVLAVAVVGYWAYDRYWSRSPAVNAALRETVESATWGEGLSEPVARMIAGQPYWVLFRGDVDSSSYSDGDGRPLQMRCLHLYAAPAVPDSGEYRRPSPRNFLGWIQWPELAMQCKPAPNNERAEK